MAKVEDVMRLPITVLIPTHNRIELLARTLDSVLACSQPIDREVRLIIVENGGQYGVERIVRRKASWIVPEYRYFKNGNKSEALNSVIESISDSLVVFLDDDVRVHPELFLNYSEAAENDKTGRFFGGGLLVDYEEPPPAWLLKYLPVSALGWHPKIYKPLGKMFFFGANWAAFSRDITAVGGFDNSFGPGGLVGGPGQETAIQQKMLKHGVNPQYVRAALVWHYVPKSRCSPDWALKRAYRAAITTGYRKYDANARKSIQGIPLWVLNSIFILSLKMVGMWIYGDFESRFRVKLKLMQDLGFIKGMISAKIRQKDDPSNSEYEC